MKLPSQPKRLLTLFLVLSTGQYQRRVQNGAGVDAPLFDEVFRDWNHSTGQSDDVDNLFWAATDHAGSVRDVLDNDHQLVNHLEYDSFGDITLAIDALKRDVNDRTATGFNDELAIDSAFAGREWDEDVDLYYNRRRYYDAGQSRFISEDPIGFASGDTNIYRYGGGDSVNFRDPTGLYQEGFSGYSPSFLGTNSYPQQGANRDYDFDLDYDFSDASFHGYMDAIVVEQFFADPEISSGGFDYNGSTPNFYGDLEGLQRQYRTNVGIQLRTAGAHITETGTALGQSIGTHAARAYYDFGSEVEIVGQSAKDTFWSAWSTLKTVASNPVAATKAIVTNTVTSGIDFVDQVTSDPEAGGKLLGNVGVFGAETATGGVFAKLGSGTVRAMKSASKVAEAVDKVEDVIDRVTPDQVSPTADGTIKCFAPDTPVITTVGDTIIDDVCVGQTIKAFDFATQSWIDRLVLARHDNHFQGVMLTIRAGGDVITTTAYHPFWVVQGERLESRPVPGKLQPGEDEGPDQAGRWVNSNDLMAGDVLKTVSGEHCVIEQIEQRYEASFRVVNLTVETDPNFAVGNLGILVHNVTDCELFNIEVSGNRVDSHPTAIGPSPEHIRYTKHSSAPNPRGTSARGIRIQSHHPVQQKWAEINLPGYEGSKAPTLTLETKSGYAHSIISKNQMTRERSRRAAGHTPWSHSVDQELQNIVDDFREVGFSDQAIVDVLGDQYRMLDKLGVPFTKPTGI